MNKIIILFTIISLLYIACEIDLPSQTRKTTRIQVIDWTNRRSKYLGVYHVEGILKNIGNITANRVTVEVRALDENDKLVSVKSGYYADKDILRPKEETTFHVMIDYSPRIKMFQVKAHCKEE